MMAALIRELVPTGLEGLIAGLAIRSVVILGAAAIAAGLARRASAAVRHLIWSAAATALLAMPLLSIVLPKWAPEIPVPAAMTRLESSTPEETPVAREARSPAYRTVVPPMTPLIVGSEALRSAAISGPEGAVASRIAAQSPRRTARAAWSALPLLWLLGCAGVLLLVIAEVARLKTIARNAVPLDNDARSELAERIARSMGLSRRPRVMEGEISVMPMTWGFRSPVVLLPAASRIWSTVRLTSVLGHELAHVRRGDYAVQLLAEFVTALYWFNPLAWYAAHRLKVERELACDDEVVAGGTAAFDYAGELLDLARSMRTLRMTSRAALSMARSSQLSGRLKAILDEQRSRFGFSRRGALVVLAVALFFSAGLASVSPAMVARRPFPPVPAVPGVSTPAPAAVPPAPAVPGVSTPAPPAPVLPALAAPSAAPRVPGALLRVPAAPLPALAPVPLPDMSLLAQAFSDDENLEGRWRAERDGDQVWFELKFRSGTHSWMNSFDIPAGEFSTISARTHDGFEIRRDAGTFHCEGPFEVSRDGARGSGAVRFEGNPEYIRAMKRRGYRVDRSQLMSMASHDVSYAFIEDIAQSGYDDLTLDRLLDFRIHGISPEFVRAMHDAGLGDIPSERLVEMRIHGVTPEFVTAMRRMGLNSYEPEHFIEMRIHGVTPEFAMEVGRLGVNDLRLDELLQMRIHGVTPDFIRGFRDAGLENVPAEQLVQLRIHGVTPELAATVLGLGYDRVTIDELVQMRIHGVTPDFIREARRNNDDDITVLEIIEMKIMGRSSGRRR